MYELNNRLQSPWLGFLTLAGLDMGVKSQVWQCLYVDNRMGNNGAGVAQLISDRAKQPGTFPAILRN